MRYFEKFNGLLRGFSPFVSKKVRYNLLIIHLSA